MSTRTARKQKHAKPSPRSFVLFNTSVSLGHGVTPPTPPDFGPSKYTLAQQLEHPTEALTRVVKDILRVGKWKVGDEHDEPVMWNVTPQVLATLQNTTKRRIAGGDAVNLGKGHGDEDLIIEPDDLISPIDDIILKDNVWWLSSYVTPEQAKYLSNPALKVSVGVLENYTAGNGQKYSMVLAHVAVTDRPVVTGQGRFLALSNKPKSYKGAMKMDFAALVEAINKLLASADLGSLPESVDETNLVVVIETMAAANGGGETPADETPADESGGEPAADAMAGMANMGMGGGRFGMSNKNADAFFMKLTNSIKASVDAAVKPLQEEVASLKTERTNNAKAEYIEFETTLGKAGVSAVTLSNKRKLAEKVGWDRGILDGLHPTITMSNVSKGQANGAAPVVPGDGHKVATNDEVAARLKARGIDPKFMPQTV